MIFVYVVYDLFIYALIYFIGWGVVHYIHTHIPYHTIPYHTYMHTCTYVYIIQT